MKCVFYTHSVTKHHFLFKKYFSLNCLYNKIRSVKFSVLFYSICSQILLLNEIIINMTKGNFLIAPSLLSKGYLSVLKLEISNVHTSHMCKL